jgi:glycogen phosphorylase
MIPNLRPFQVFPAIPEKLKPLSEIGRNLWWVWNHEAADLFRRLDRELWEQTHHNPVKLLGLLSPQQLNEAANDQGYMAQLNRVYRSFKEHVDTAGWFRTHHENAKDMLVAYFSAEFGLHESLPIYSGGLGVLAGDHLKSASEIDVPLVGVGLLYRQGYFQQYLSSDGWQQESYPDLDFYNLAVEPILTADKKPLTVYVDLPDNRVHIRVWRVSVGRIKLHLLDTNLDENAPADRDITSRLYGGGTEMRIKQEIVLGIGGVRALTAMGIKPSVFHMNEGHSAFLALERIRVLLENSQMSFDEVRNFVAAGSVFTTHTPVPAGIDMFPPELVSRYFKNFWPGLKLDEEGFLALGREDVTNKRQGFSMAVLALRLAEGCNAVSKLHGEVSRDMWHSIWPGVPKHEVPITHVTNGIHVRSWVSGEIVSVLDRYLGDSWMHDPMSADAWSDVETIPDEELWRAHERCRERLVIYTRQALKKHVQARGGTLSDIATAEQVLDPDALTIGFARRFATYKRGTLLLRDRERIKQIINNSSRPVQFIFAGKAHPADQGGKELIRAIVDFARDPVLRRRFVFIENYDMSVARMLVQGVDVWLNTPRRPYEASGTSGMKASANGVLNLSVLDGWWVEGYDPSVGWAIGRGEQYADSEYADHLEAQSLYDALERGIVPAFYERDNSGVPMDWVRRMKANLRKLAPVFNTNRMVAQYGEKLYLPAHARGSLLGKDNCKQSIELAHTKARLRHHWHNIKVIGVEPNRLHHYKVGESFDVQAIIDLAGLSVSDVRVQIYSGLVTPDQNIEKPEVADLQPAGEVSPGHQMFKGTIVCRGSGRQAFGVRVVPGAKGLVNEFEPGLIQWG